MCVNVLHNTTYICIIKTLVRDYRFTNAPLSNRLTRKRGVGFWVEGRDVLERAIEVEEMQNDLEVHWSGNA